MKAFFKKQPPIRSLIGEGTVLHGEVRFGDGLRIDGEVHGDIVAVGDERNILVISEKARVHGKVNAGHVIINGSVIGPVHSDELTKVSAVSPLCEMAMMTSPLLITGFL